ncbi:MAG: hypothetical protein HFI28_00535 [Lachnospiraceae bacterium]|nr:hypothetical protein [Lachnospiraceae bacterium]
MRNKFILWLGISLVCFTAFVLSVRAAEKETVSLNNVNGQIEATLELPVEENPDGSFTPPEDIVAIQLSFQISGPGSIKKEDVSFDFGSGIPEGTMTEYRYQEDTGVLNIYVSGNKNIYSSKNISLGKVIVNSDEKTTVKVVKDSFKTVNRAHGMYEGEVNTGDGGQTVNNGSSGGSSGGDDDVGEIMRPPEETKKPDEGNNSGSSGEGIFSDGEQAEKIDKNKPLAGTTGSAKKILDAVLKGTAGDGSLELGSEDGSLKDEESKGEDEEDASLIPEDSLWEDGAKLWREKTGAIGMDVWTKIFFGLFAGSAIVAGGIGISMAVRTSGKRKRRRRNHAHRGRNVYTSAKQRPQTKKREAPVRTRSEQARKRKEPTRVHSELSGRREQKGRTAGRPQGRYSRQEQPVWKDSKKTYSRKRRKIS